MKTINEIINVIESTNPRSAWNRGVKTYALSILEDMPQDEEIATITELENIALNGAYNWNHYSWSGCALCYNYDIARRLCTPSELKKTHNGMNRPNAREEWLDVQARALYQAWQLIRSAAL